MKRPEELFKALADETRLRIVHLLRASGRSLCVCELVDALHLPQYQVSRHLTGLKEADLVAVEKHGTWAYHDLRSDEATEPLWRFLEQLLTGEPYDSDAARLELRLALRAGDHCVVGYVSPEELEKLARQRAEKGEPV